MKSKSNEIGSLLELTKRFKAMEAELGRKTELLRKYQWSSGDGFGGYCPACDWRYTEGHAPDCKLAREIKTGENQ